MLARVALDRTAVLTDGGDGSLAPRSRQQELLKILMRHGRLVFADSEDEAKFLMSLEGLPQSLRTLWKTHLPKIPVDYSGASRSVTGITSSSRLAATWTSLTDVGYFSPQAAGRLGLPETDAAFVEPMSDIEVGRIDYPRSSERLQALERLALMDIASGEARDDVWEERLEPLVSSSRTLTILDRYAGIDLIRTARPNQGDGLRWLLAKLDSAPTSTAAHLIVQADSRSQSGTIASAAARLADEFAGGQLETLTLTVAPKTSFRDAAHPRHLRFGHRCLVLDRGVATFEEPSCCQHSPCTVSWDSSSARQREQAVEAQAYQRRKILW